MKIELDPLLPYDFIHYLTEVLNFGAGKHGGNNWKQPNGKKSSHKDMHASLFRHVGASSAGIKEDHETNLHPLQHAAVRCLMQVYRDKHNLIHVDDRGENYEH